MTEEEYNKEVLEVLRIFHKNFDDSVMALQMECGGVRPEFKECLFKFIDDIWECEFLTEGPIEQRGVLENGAIVIYKVINNKEFPICLFKYVIGLAGNFVHATLEDSSHCTIASAGKI